MNTALINKFSRTVEAEMKLVLAGRHVAASQRAFQAFVRGLGDTEYDINQTLPPGGYSVNVHGSKAKTKHALVFHNVPAVSMRAIDATLEHVETVKGVTVAPKGPQDSDSDVFAFDVSVTVDPGTETVAETKPPPRTLRVDQKLVRNLGFTGADFAPVCDIMECVMNLHQLGRVITWAIGDENDTGDDSDTGTFYLFAYGVPSVSLAFYRFLRARHPAIVRNVLFVGPPFPDNAASSYRMEIHCARAPLTRKRGGGGGGDGDNKRVAIDGAPMRRAPWNGTTIAGGDNGRDNGRDDDDDDDDDDAPARPPPRKRFLGIW